MIRLRRLTEADLARRRRAVDPATLTAAARIVEAVASRGEAALVDYARRFDGLQAGEPILIERAELEQARDALGAAERGLLERTAERIGAFARVQLGALHPCVLDLPGGRAGHTVVPVERAGCYAPGGRFPLPSSVLMTTVTARVAGVDAVWVASPRPAPITLAAAAVAGADGLLRAGGAQAIAALAFGAGLLPAADLVVGPGNRWVTAAKQLVAGQVGVDLWAGPSELVVLADDTADPTLVAADLLAQAEHDPDAMPMLVALSPAIADAIEKELGRQLATLPTATTAAAALRNGGAIVIGSREAAAAVCDRLAPEHLQLAVADPDEWVGRLHHYGALFFGRFAAEVLGDYGAGPNHVLPTGGTARFSGGLSVMTFLRVRSWLALEDSAGAAELARDAAALARLEGLLAHARAADRRRVIPTAVPPPV